MTRRTHDGLTLNTSATRLVLIPPSRAAMIRSRRSCEYAAPICLLAAQLSLWRNIPFRKPGRNPNKRRTRYEWVGCALAPGRVPRPSVESPTHTGLGWMLLAGKAMMFLGWMIGHSTLRLIGILNMAVAIVAGMIVGRQIKPARMQLGWLHTFRDLSRAMTGEVWGDWHGFPMD